MQPDDLKDLNVVLFTPEELEHFEKHLVERAENRLLNIYCIFKSAKVLRDFYNDCATILGAKGETVTHRKDWSVLSSIDDLQSYYATETNHGKLSGVFQNHLNTLDPKVNTKSNTYPSLHLLSFLRKKTGKSWGDIQPLIKNFKTGTHPISTTKNRGAKVIAILLRSEVALFIPELIRKLNSIYEHSFNSGSTTFSNSVYSAALIYTESQLWDDSFGRNDPNGYLLCIKGESNKIGARVKLLKEKAKAQATLKAVQQQETALLTT